MMPTLSQLLAARATFSEHRERLVGVDDPRARHHVDLFGQAIAECTLLIRGERLVAEVLEQRAHAAGRRRA